MLKVLKTALYNNRIISFCVGKVDWEKRIIGYVRSISNKKIMIDVVDIYGVVIKQKSINPNNIVILEIDDNYNKHLEKLKKEGKISKKTKSFYYYNNGTNFEKKINMLLLKGDVYTIFFGSEYVTGIIKKVTGNVLIINSVGFRGTKEGKSFCVLQCITKIRYQGPLEKKISYLLKKN